MPLFGSKTSTRTVHVASPAKADARVPSPHFATGPRRSLSKALAEVVNSRKGDPAPPQRPKINTAIRPSLTRNNSEDAGDSSTAVESSSSGTKPRVAGQVRQATNIQSSPLKQSTQLPVAPPSPTSTASRVGLRSKKGKPASPSPRPPSVSTAPFGRARAAGGASSPAVSALPVGSIQTPSPGRTGSTSPSTRYSASPTVGRRMKAPSALPTPKKQPPIALVSKPVDKPKQSGLRPPKARPASAIYLGSTSLASAPSRQPLTEHNVQANERASNASQNLALPFTKSVSTRKVNPDKLAASDSDHESSCSTPGRIPERAVSPLPRRSLRNMPSLALSSISSLQVPGPSAETASNSNSKENDSSHEAGPEGVAARQSISRITSLPRPSGIGPPRPRHSVAAPDNRPQQLRAGVSSRAPSESSDRQLGAKRRRSELPAASTSSSQTFLRPQRTTNLLQVPRQKTPQPKHVEKTPSTPTTSSHLAARTAQHTFSVPKKRITATPLADMTFSEIPEDDDDEDDDVTGNDSFRFHVPSSISSRQSTQDDADDDETTLEEKVARGTPTLFLTTSTSQPGLRPQRRQRTITLTTPSRSITAPARRRRPTIRARGPAPGAEPRYSFMPLEASFERSREYSHDDDATDDMLADIPAPFDTPSVLRGSTSASVSVISDGSLILNESEIGLLPSPSVGTNMSSPVGHHMRLPNGGDGITNISRLLFDPPPPSTTRSGATSPLPHSFPASRPGSPKSPSGPDNTHTLLLQVRTASLEAELAELRAHFEERETITLTQQTRISSLESELSTVYSVTRARDASNATIQMSLKQQLMTMLGRAARREWEAVGNAAQAEADAIAAERQLLDSVFSSLDILLLV